MAEGGREFASPESCDIDYEYDNLGEYVVSQIPDISLE